MYIVTMDDSRPKHSLAVLCGRTEFRVESTIQFISMSNGLERVPQVAVV